MERTSEPVSPLMMLQVLHMYYPQFAEKSEHGGFQQQVDFFPFFFLITKHSEVTPGLPMITGIAVKITQKVYMQ